MEDNRAEEQAGAQFESIKSLLAACNCDYDRKDELEEQEERTREEEEELQELKEQAGENENREQAETRLIEDPLSIDRESTYSVLLCTGGPAVRIFGYLDEHGEPYTAILQYQDWYTPWKDYPEADEETLLDYVSSIGVYFE